MSGVWSKAAAALASALLGLAAAFFLTAFAAAPNAQPSRGSEDFFAHGLLARELGPAGPIRWTRPTSWFVFRNLPPGPAALEVRVHGHREGVTVSVNGTEQGSVRAGRFVGRFALQNVPADGVLEVELKTPGFDGHDGVRRGALLDRVRVMPPPAGWPSTLVAAAFLGLAVLAAVAGMALGLPPAAAAGLAAVLTLIHALALAPHGILYSRYASTLPTVLALSILAAWGGARLLRGRRPGACPWVFVALLAALLVQAVAATSPLMVGSDVLFHANRLRAVAAGDYYPTSVTQHAVPFQIPYGVSFYAVLAPLARMGLDPLALVRAGAGFSNVVASAGLLWFLLPLGAPRAALAVLLLQMLPGTFDIYSYGNLSNAFAQAMTALFFCWWAGSTPGGSLVGGLLLAAGAIGHLSSLIVLVALCAALLYFRSPRLRQERTRLFGLAVGFGLAGLYYLHFTELIVDQIPRLLEGGGQGRGASMGVMDALSLQLREFGGQWGIPTILLAAAACASRQALGAIPRDILAYGLGVSLLFFPAIASPLEVRYPYALGLPIAVLAAGGFFFLRARGRAGAGVAWALLAAQVCLAAYNLQDAILRRYRT